MKQRFKIDGEYIRLCDLLKAAGIASTGGQAKVFIINGEVKINGEKCTQKGKKVIPGETVRIFGDEIEVC